MSALHQTAEAPEAPAGNVTQFPLPRQVTLDLDDAQRMEEMLIRFRDEILVRGVDYGIIKGTPKATLYKPGGEKLLQFFGLGFTLEITRNENWDKNRVAYEVKTIVHDKKTGQIVTEGVGSCNSRERNYKNKDAADIANTCLKMAKKRSLLDGVLTATCSSGLFEDGDQDDYQRGYNQGSRQNQGRQGNQQQRNQQRPPQNAQQKWQQPAQKARAATREELERCERARSRAVSMGYLTAQGGEPKPLADGTPIDEAVAKCKRWEAFISERIELSELGLQNEQPKDPKGPRILFRST